MKQTSRAAVITMIFMMFSGISVQAEPKGSGDFFGDFDADNDGVVSQEEFTGPEGHFSRLDANGDGQIGAGEGPSGPPAGEHAARGPGGPQNGGPRDEGPNGEGPGGEGPGGGGPGGRS